ncbi:UPF0175 family protein [Candidatus Thiodictyon syntrophicum]|jgi:hypothetical protein|uniref:UPF0175 family protein n=1 Tax=Candidatus Thiodictyon syntrophicum TaxID=1166950 RepID=UPI0026BE86AB
MTETAHLLRSPNNARRLLESIAELDQGRDTERLATRTTNPEPEPMSTAQINPDFVPVLEPLGQGAGNFFLAASLYHSHKISFAAAAALAGLGFDEFHDLLKEHFGYGMVIDDETVREDLRLVNDIHGLDLSSEGLDQAGADLAPAR